MCQWCVPSLLLANISLFSSLIFCNKRSYKILLNLCPHLVGRWNYPWRQDSNAAEKCCQLVTKILTAMSLLHSISRVQESYILPYLMPHILPLCQEHFQKTTMQLKNAASLSLSSSQCYCFIQFEQFRKVCRIIFFLGEFISRNSN